MPALPLEDLTLLFAKERANNLLFVSNEADRAQGKATPSAKKQLELLQGTEETLVAGAVKLREKLGDEKFRTQIEAEYARLQKLMESPKDLGVEIDAELKKRKSDAKADPMKIKERITDVAKLSTGELMVNYVRNDTFNKAQVLMQARRELKKTISVTILLEELHGKQTGAVKKLQAGEKQLKDALGNEKGEAQIRTILEREYKKTKEFKRDSKEFEKQKNNLKEALQAGESFVLFDAPDALRYIDALVKIQSPVAPAKGDERVTTVAREESGTLQSPSTKQAMLEGVTAAFR